MDISRAICCFNNFQNGHRYDPIVHHPMPIECMSGPGMSHDMSNVHMVCHTLAIGDVCDYV